MDKIIARLEAIALRDSEGKPVGGAEATTRPLTDKERWWIRNERQRCACDAAYFLTRYATIKNDANQVMRFAFRNPQKVYFSAIAALERRRAAIQLQVLKGRQLGVSTITELLVAHRIFFTYGVNAVIASSAQQQTQIMSHMIFLCYDNLPYWLKPPFTRRSESDKGQLAFGGINTGVSFQHGSQTSGIARGHTPTVVHLCVAGKTPVKMASGVTALMREVMAGDRVIAKDGTAVNVSKAWKSPRTNEITSEIMLWGEPSPLATTRDHLVFTETGWREARTVVSGEYLYMPVRPIEKLSETISMMDIPTWTKKRECYRKPIAATYELGWIVGLYLAEGCMSRSKNKTICSVIYACHEKEEEWFRSSIEAVFGELSRATCRRKTSKTCTIPLNNRGFAEWLSENFGEKDDKRIPELCWQLGGDFARGVLIGYLDGDGHYAPRSNSILASSVRSSLSYGMRDLAASLGYGWGAITYREAGINYGRNCKSIWTLGISGQAASLIRKDAEESINESSRPEALHWKWNEGKNGIWIEVASNNDGISEDFYDLEVDHADHAFCTAQALIHNSEVASFPNAEELIDASLFRAVHEHPNVFMVLESTAEGVDNWWHKKWKKSKEDWPKGRSKLCPLFLPWYIGTEMYPKPAWLHTRPIPADWVPSKETQLRMAKAKAFVAASPLLVEVLGEDWEMGKEQAWFSEVDFEEYKANGNERLWKQEMAGDDIECFSGSFDSVFGNTMLEALNETRDRDYMVYTITGHGIEDQGAHPDDIDYDADRRLMQYANNRGDRYAWTLTPVRRDYIDDEDEQNSAEQVDMKLLVFKEPEVGFDYTLGVDTGGGVGRDQTVVEVWRKGRAGMPDVQCAEFSSVHISHVNAYAYVMAIASLYAKYMRDERYESKYREPLVSVEQIAAVGDTVQSQMKIMGYARFFLFHQLDTKVIKKKNATRMGWRTSGWSRPILVDGFVHSVKNEWLVINSPFLLREMSNFEVHMKSGRARLEHAEDHHDDRIFGSAIAVYTSHDMEAMVERGKSRPIPVGPKYRPILDLTPSMLTFNTGGDALERSMIPIKTTRDLEDFIANERLSY